MSLFQSLYREYFRPAAKVIDPRKVAFQCNGEKARIRRCGRLFVWLMAVILSRVW